jgi:hypothetical protein
MDAPQATDARAMDARVEDCHEPQGDCDLADILIEIVIAEFIPQVTDGVRAGWGAFAGGGAGARLEWNVMHRDGHALDVAAGVVTMPAETLAPERPGRHRGDRDGVLSLALSGSGPVVSLKEHPEQSVRGVAEMSFLVTVAEPQLRLTAGPRYRYDLGATVLTVDLMAGAHVGAGRTSPAGGLRLGVRWN